MAVFTPTDRPNLKSVCNRCVIELFGGVFVLSLFPFNIFVDIWAFVIRLSQISSFFFLMKIAALFNTIMFFMSILLKERVRRFSVEVKRTELNCVI